jgi:hypothetical protein
MFVTEVLNYQENKIKYVIIFIRRIFIKLYGVFTARN